MSSFSSWPIKTKEQRARKRVMQKREKKRRQDLLKARNLPFQKYVQFFKCLVQWLLSQLKTAQTGLRRFLKIISLFIFPRFLVMPGIRRSTKSNAVCDGSPVCAVVFHISYIYTYKHPWLKFMTKILDSW